MPAKKKTTNHPGSHGLQAMGPGAVKDIVEQVVRDALRTQAREMEKYLQDINTRLVALEKR
jgi:hypothetical protein